MVQQIYSRRVEQEVTEEDERVISMFMASDAAPQRTLADIIMERINEKDVGGDATAGTEGPYTIYF